MPARRGREKQHEEGSHAERIGEAPVHQPGLDDRPDISTLHAFAARGNQGIAYNTGVWRKRRPIHPSIMGVVLKQPRRPTDDGIRQSL